jgi:DNA-binding transcriptional MerR regulator
MVKRGLGQGLIMADLSIGEVARRAGVNASAIRFYERSGLVAPPPRRSGRRCYDPAIVPRLRAIAAARAAGLGLEAIRDLLAAAGGRPAFDQAVQRQIHAVDRRMTELAELRAALEAAARCGCAVPASCPGPA